MKAHIIFREGGVTPALYADLSRAVTLLDYPLHVPVLEAWFFRWLGAPDDRLVGIIFWLYYLSLPMVVYGVGRRWGASGIIPLLAATAIATLGHVVGLAASAFTDLILAVLVTMAAIYLIDWLIGARPGVLFLGAIAAGLLPWIKREGLVLFIVLLLAFLFAIVFARRLHRRSPPWRRVMMAIIAYSLAAMIIAGPWWIFAGREAVANGAFLPLSPATFFANAERLPTIGWLMTTQLLRPEFGFIWLLMLLASFFALRKRFLFREAILALPIAAFLYLFLMGLIYVFSDFFPYQQHVLASTFRLGSQVAPLLIIWLAFGLKANREEVL